MAEFPPPQPHAPIRALTDRVYVVRGAMRMNAVLRISRNFFGGPSPLHADEVAVLPIEHALKNLHEILANDA